MMEARVCASDESAARPSGLELIVATRFAAKDRKSQNIAIAVIMSSAIPIPSLSGRISAS